MSALALGLGAIVTLPADPEVYAVTDHEWTDSRRWVQVRRLFPDAAHIQDGHVSFRAVPADVWITEPALTVLMGSDRGWGQ